MTANQDVAGTTLQETGNSKTSPQSKDEISLLTVRYDTEALVGRDQCKEPIHTVMHSKFKCVASLQLSERQLLFAIGQLSICAQSQLSICQLSICAQSQLSICAQSFMHYRSSVIRIKSILQYFIYLFPCTRHPSCMVCIMHV